MSAPGVTPRAVPSIDEDEQVLLILATMGQGISDLKWSDRQLVYGRALGRLRNAHREEFERYRRLEAARIMVSGDSYP